MTNLNSISKVQIIIEQLKVLKAIYLGYFRSFLNYSLIKLTMNILCRHGNPLKLLRIFLRFFKYFKLVPLFIQLQFMYRNLLVIHAVREIS